MSQQNLKTKKEIKAQTGYSPIGEEKKVYEKYLDRKAELLQSRKNVMGLDIDELMRRFDKNYFNREADIPPSELDVNQKPLSINNAFGKVQAALSIMIDRNPTIILNEKAKKYSANRELIKSLALHSWKNTNSLGQFKLSMFNAAKRGWMAGRTYNKKLITEARFPMKMDEKGRIAYESRMVTKIDDIAYMNLNNHNVWFDEEALPEDFYSIRDAMHRELWHIDKVRQIFPEKEFPNMKWVNEGGNKQEIIDGQTNASNSSNTNQKELKKGLTEIYFYENQYDDWFIVEINGVMVVWEPLPQNHKRLSYTTSGWNMRNAETLYHIGIIEEMEKDEALIDRIMNMSMRQLLLSINPPGFYQGTEDLEDENIKLKAGVLRRVTNPQDIKFLDIKAPGAEPLNTINWLEEKENQKTGITKLLEGEAQTQAGDTAFELGVSRESSLKRLKLPIKSFQYALDWEFRNRIDLIKQTYSDFDVEHIADPEEIQSYLDEVDADRAFYFIENEGEAGQEVFYAKKYREFQLQLEQTQKGDFVESEGKSFFKIKPEYLSFEGDVTIDMNSMLIQSEELEKADTLRLSNLLIPLFDLDKAKVLKPATELLRSFNKDPKKWLPNDWLQEQVEEKTEMPMPGEEIPEVIPGQETKPEQLKAQTIIPQSQIEGTPATIQPRFQQK